MGSKTENSILCYNVVLYTVCFFIHDKKTYCSSLFSVLFGPFSFDELEMVNFCFSFCLYILLSKVTLCESSFKFVNFLRQIKNID